MQASGVFGSMSSRCLHGFTVYGKEVWPATALWAQVKPKNSNLV